MKDLFNLFYDWVIGQKPEISDPSSPFQCMDLAYQWTLFLHYPKSTISHLYAKQVFTNPNSDTQTYFDIVPNSPSFIPQCGDLVVFDATSTNIAGHIAVANGDGDTSRFTSLDENWTANGIVTLISHNYDNPKLLGVLRPKIIAGEINDQTKINIGGNYGTMELQAIRSTLTDKDQAIATLKRAYLDLQTEQQIALDSAIAENDAGWKSKYDNINSALVSCLASGVNSLTAGQLFSLAWKKLWNKNV